MAFWILLASGTLLLLTAAIMGAKQFVKSKNLSKNKNRFSKQPTKSEPVDEIDAYWGSAMPEIHEENPKAVQQNERPPLRCASYHENEIRPKVLGDDGRRLGIGYFQYLLDMQVLPRGAVSLTNESNIIIAQNALKNKQQSATLSHSAVAQRIGEKALCIFEPLTLAVENVDKAIDALKPLVQGKTTFFILESTEYAPEECLAHIPKICEHFKIPQSHIFIRQVDGSFLNYIEDTRNFAPARLDTWTLAPNFFSQLLDYAQNAFDEGDSETVMRALAPLLAPLYQRVYTKNDFPLILLAQALNLVGMTNRALKHENEAVACFEAAYHMLRKIEDYEALKAVEANLGITLALIEPPTEANLDKAVKYLKDVTELNKNDDEAWLYLAHSYLQLFRLNNTKANLMRAQKAYAQAYALNPTQSVAKCLNEIGMFSLTKNSNSNDKHSEQAAAAHPNERFNENIPTAKY